MKTNKLLTELGFLNNQMYPSYCELRRIQLSPDRDSDYLAWKLYNRTEDIVGRVVRITEGQSKELCAFVFKDGLAQVSLNGSIVKDRISTTEAKNLWLQSLSLNGETSMDFSF